MAVLDDILTALAANVEGLGLAWEATAVPVFERKPPTHRTARDPVRQITVSKADSPERVKRWSFQKDRTDYVCNIVIVTPHGGPDADQATYAEWRQTLLDTFAKPPLTGASVVFDVKAEPLDYLPAGAAEKQWDYQAVQVTASVVRER